MDNLEKRLTNTEAAVTLLAAAFYEVAPPATQTLLGEIMDDYYKTALALESKIDKQCNGKFIGPTSYAPPA